MNMVLNKKCGAGLAVWALLFIGGLNWGLVGLGSFLGKDLDVVNMIFGSMSSVENAIYVLVGLAALASLFHCKCKKCNGGCACTDGNCSHCNC